MQKKATRIRTPPIRSRHYGRRFGPTPAKSTERCGSRVILLPEGNRLLYCLVLAALCLGGCSNPEATFSYPVAGSIKSLDPRRADDEESVEIIRQVFEGLVGWNKKDQICPVLAKTWEISPGATVYTFHLRKELRFSDGSRVTAQAFKACLDNRLNPKNDAPAAADIFQDVEDIQAPDSETLQIRLKNPTPYFIEELTCPATWLYKTGNDESLQAGLCSPDNFVGTGPYEFESADLDTAVSLIPNPCYAGARAPFEKIKVLCVSDPATRLALYDNDEVQAAALEHDQIDQYHETKTHDHAQRISKAGVWYLAMNESLWPYSEKNVRKAIAMAINREMLAEKVFKTSAARSFLPPRIFDGATLDRPFIYGQDKGQAKKLWDQADRDLKRKHKAGLPQSLTLYFPSSGTDGRAAAELIRQDIKEVLHVNVDFKALDWREIGDLADRKLIPFVFMGWIADYPDPQDFLSKLFSHASHEDFVNYNNPAFDKDCAYADRAPTDRRVRTYQDAEQLVLHDAVVVPIAYDQSYELVSKDCYDTGRSKSFQNTLQNCLMGRLPLADYDQAAVDRTVAGKPGSHP